MDDDEGSSPWADAPSSPPPPPSSRPQTPAIRTSIDAVLDSEPTITSPPKPTAIHEPSPLVVQPPPLSFPSPPSNDFEEEQDDGFDDFDDPPPAGAAPVEDAFGGDDDFGDFGDFEEDAGQGGGEGFDEVELEEGGGGDEVATSFVAPPSAPPPPPSYTPLHLSPFPDAQTLAATVQSILAPIFPDLDPDSQMGSEDVRQVPGLGQVLVDEESRNLYKSLTSVPPLARLDWTRSRVRREHLITLGVPVNLDEVASTKPPSLPTLRISTLQQQSSSSSNLSPSNPPPDRPTSTPPAPRPNAPKRSNTVTGSSSSTYRRAMSATAPTGASAARPNGSGANTPNGGGRVVGPGTDVDLSKVKGGRTDKTYGLGKMPEMDLSQAKELLDVPSDSLSLLSLPSLQQLHSSLEQTTASASVLLSYLLQLKDAQQHEALISNGLIGELINAQRLAMTAAAGSGGGGGGGWRRSVQVGQGSSGRSPGR